MKTININSGSDVYQVSWQHESLFTNILKLQRSILFGDNSQRLTFDISDSVEDNAEQFFNHLWNTALEEKRYDDLPYNPVILDIGSGIGIMDVIAHKYLKNTGNFYLLDKSERTYSPEHNIKNYYSVNHGFYNNRLVTEDVLKSSGCNLESFKMISPEDNWPEQIDLITSWVSYCWHYPLETYWDKVKKHLKVGGKFAIEILKKADDESRVIDTISKEFNSTPRIRVMSDNEGYRCVWIRNS